MSLKVQTAIVEDASAIAALVNSAYRGESSRKGWTTEADLLGGQRTDTQRIETFLTSSDHIFLLFYRGDELVASVLLQNRGKSSYLGMLTVKPTLQSSGIGREVLATCEQWVVCHWYSMKMEMTVIKQRVELIDWYVRRGYKLTGEEEPFPSSDVRAGIPKVADLRFVVLEKKLHALTT